MLKYIISPSWRIHVGFVSNSFQIGMHPIIGSIEHKHSNKASAVNRNQFIHYYVTHIHHNFIHYGIHTIFSLCLALAFHSFLYVCIVLFPSLYFIYVSHCKRSHITFTYYQISISCDCYCLFFFFNYSFVFYSPPIYTSATLLTFTILQASQISFDFLLCIVT